MFGFFKKKKEVEPALPDATLGMFFGEVPSWASDHKKVLSFYDSVYKKTIHIRKKDFNELYANREFLKRMFKSVAVAEAEGASFEEQINVASKMTYPYILDFIRDNLI